ncbi:MAG: hypothetical protein QNI87_05165 [Erythrobacter sp.]|uniref:hypothetical protein n=1 Tax=Erythrobacter sp. TaxID=1042 RepID=UPI00261113C4|nr:hypothetical protein [Erythrobacter sp.]MDJ0977907.1 hypothetical protein [Erythrobacter sp.]
MSELDAPDPKAIDWARKDASRKDFSQRANLAFLVKCFGIGVLALLIPILLPLIGGYEGHFSISFFYHVPEARNWFVGLLWAVGIFLILFQGLSRAENLLLTLAGVFLILVALVPTTTDQCNESLFSLHAAFAVAFFVCLFIVAIFFSKSRLDYILWPPLRARFKRAYDVTGCLMIALPALAYGVHLVDGRDCGHEIYWIEFAAIAAFSAFWFVKTWEYKRLLGLSVRDVARRLVS